MNITFPDMEEYQKALFRIYRDNPKGKLIVTKAIRLCGKSICLELLLIYASINTKWSDSLAISPVMALSRKLFNDILKIAEPLIKKANGSLLEITFINGSRIKFGSAELGDTLRGNTIKQGGILCIDEAAYIDEDFYYSILLPTTNVFSSNVFLFSTPRFKLGLFYDMFQKGLGDSENIISLDWTDYDTSKFLSKETLEIYRKQLPRLAFQSEYLGLFIDGDGLVFSDFKKCCNKATLDTRYEVNISIDWGSGANQDYTVLTIGQYNPEMNKIIVQKQIRFNDKNTNLTVEAIKMQVDLLVSKGFKNIDIIVEKNSIGAVYYSVMQDALDEYEVNYNKNAEFKNEIAITTGMFTTTNKSKERIIKNLIMCFENEDIIIPDDLVLMNELSAYECKISASGNAIYNAPTGMHDDTVMSLCFLVGLLYNNIEK